MGSTGLWIGLGLVVLAIVCALALGAKAAQGVARFRAEDHESFTGRGRS